MIRNSIVINNVCLHISMLRYMLSETNGEILDKQFISITWCVRFSIHMCVTDWIQWPLLNGYVLTNSESDIVECWISATTFLWAKMEKTNEFAVILLNLNKKINEFHAFLVNFGSNKSSDNFGAKVKKQRFQWTSVMKKMITVQQFHHVQQT